MKSTDTNFDNEWARVAQNPDNMIVSDVIKESIDKMLTTPDTRAEVPPVVTLTGVDCQIDMEMSKIDFSPTGWTVTCVTGMSDGYTLIKKDRKSWKSIAACSEPGGEELWRLDIRSDVIGMTLEFPPSTGLCLVTLSCSNEREQTRIL